MPPTTQSAAAGATNALTSSMDNSLGADSGAVMAPISPNGTSHEIFNERCLSQEGERETTLIEES